MIRAVRAGRPILSHPDQGEVDGNQVKRTYGAQDGGNEQRVLLCAPYSKFAACTTHLSAGSRAVAGKQCQELSEVATRFGAPAVVGGDFNLAYGGNPDVQGCVPERWFRKGDGSVQHVLATNAGFRFHRTGKLPIDGTDHPGLLVEMSRK